MLVTLYHRSLDYIFISIQMFSLRTHEVCGSDVQSFETSEMVLLRGCYIMAQLPVSAVSVTEFTYRNFLR